MRIARLPWILLSLAIVLPARADDRATRVFADSFITWIYPRPTFDSEPIGYLRAGTGAQRAEGNATRAAGCPGGFQPIAPAGYVCLGRSASLTETRYSESLASLAPREGPFPFHFALSMGSPAYRRLPTSSEIRRQEAKFGRATVRPLPPHWEGHEELVGGEFPVATAAPTFFDERGSASRLPENRLVRREVPFGSMIAYSSTFEHDGRTYLQSADGTIVPAERFRPFRRSSFAGVSLDDETTLPLAWTRREAAVYESACASDAASDAAPTAMPGQLAAVDRRPSSCALAAGQRLSVRALVPLSGRRRTQDKITYLETRSGQWIRQADVYVAERPTELVSTREKWIHFSIAHGTLIAFDGSRPVFATLASPGIGGRPRVGGDPLADRTTPLGTFRVQFKHKSDDMSPEQSEHRTFFIADVPHALFFQPPFAIHVAYWHESFGEPMSGGCINVSPHDGERLFGWSDPPLPPDWHGVAAGPQFGPGTWVRVVSE